ncbi:MAG TPA: hypothetical protein VHS31_06100 [Tepidisphaeraceae bacterium]|jgi:hypothetical protein|nr:hypothetical protein [Tepidisphaeraceae bacterium]
MKRSRFPHHPVGSDRANIGQEMQVLAGGLFMVSFFWGTHSKAVGFGAQL